MLERNKEIQIKARRLLLWVLSITCFTLLNTVMALDCQAQSYHADLLTQQEREWLDAHPVITLGPDPCFPPIECLDEDGIYRGIAADYIALVEKNLGIKFKIVRLESWDEVIKQTRNRQIDVWGAATNSPQRSKYMLFTPPHIELPGIIISKQGGWDKLTMEQLKDMRVAVVSNYIWQDFIENDYPDMKLILVPDIQTGLKEVSFGTADAFINDLTTASYHIEKEGIMNLRVSGETGYFTRLAFASRSDWPELNSILEKGLAQIGQAEVKSIFTKWVHLKGGSLFDKKEFWISLFGGLGLVGTIIVSIMVWNRSLKKQVELKTEDLKKELVERESLEEELKKSRDELESRVKERTIEVSKLSHAVEQSSSTVVITDVNGIIEYVNPRFTQTTGYTPEEVLGKTPRVLKSGKTLPEVYKELWKTITTGNEWQGELHNKKKNGELYWAFESISPVKDEIGVITNYIAVKEDITERKLFENKIISFAHILEESLNEIYIFDAKTLRYIQVNKGARLNLGYSMEELVSLTPLDFTLEFTDESFAKVVEPLRSGEKEKIEFTTVHLRKDGSLYEVEIHLQLSTFQSVPVFVAIALDITERKKAGEQIRKLSRAVEQSSSIVVITDVNGIIEYVNPRFTQTTGYTPEEVLGKTPRVLKSGNIKQEVYRELWSTISSGNEWMGEFHNKKKSGELFWESVSISPIRNKEGVITHFIAVKEDITERKQVESRLKVAMKEALRANKTKSVFLSSMSHELRTPMNSILGFAQLLDSDIDVPLSESQKDNVKHILKSGNHLLKLINEVLDLSGIESGKVQIFPESIEIDAAINEAMATVELLAQENSITIDYLAKSDGQYIRADSGRLNQVLINLLSNAIKYNNDGGSVSIWNEFPTDTIVRINIEDTGSGIANEKYDSLFEPFNRLGAESLNIEGTGVGLTITKKLVEMMDGSIGVESAIGKGTKFYVDFKKAESPVHTTGGKEEVVEEEHNTEITEKYTILYVEDNPANLKLVETILKCRPDFRLLTAPHAQLGIELARANNPDLILMDINLPGMDGYEALKFLKNHDQTKEIPIIALSANAMPKDIERGKAAGFKYYLTKPININKFLEVIDTILMKTKP